MKHACTACTCTVPTLAEHAASSMGPCHLTHFDLHRCGALLHVCRPFLVWHMRCLLLLIDFDGIRAVLTLRDVVACCIFHYDHSTSPHKLSCANSIVCVSYWL